MKYICKKAPQNGTLLLEALGKLCYNICKSNRAVGQLLHKEVVLMETVYIFLSLVVVLEIIRVIRRK